MTEELPLGLELASADPCEPALPNMPAMEELRRNVEALLFASGEPLSADKMLEALAMTGEEGRRRVDATLADLREEYSGGRHGIEVVRLAGGWAFRTDAHRHAVVSRLFELPDDAGRLSPAALECLAVIAYLQPVSRPQIAEIRGVHSDSTVHTLIERELVTEVGRSQAAGGAVLYGTTNRFEAMFGLAGLDELPPLEGFALTEDQKDELRRRLGLLTIPE